MQLTRMRSFAITVAEKFLLSRETAALPEDPGTIPSTHMVALNAL